MASITRNPGNSLSSLKMRVWSSLDFTIGYNSPPRKDTGLKSATHIDAENWWNGYKFERKLFVETNQGAIDRVIESRHPGTLDDDQRAALFNAYEASGQYERAIALIESAASIGLSPMGLSALTIYHSPSQKKKRGAKGITSRGKKMVRSCAAILEKQYGKSCLSLLTLTIPSDLDDSEFDSVVLNWAELQRQFWQQVGRILVRRGLPGDFVFVNEVQEKRFHATGRVGLHSHGLFVGRKSRKHWAISHHEFRAIWEGLLSNLLDREIECPAATRVESIRKSCQAELGKYISKGCKIIEAITSAGKADLLPSAWYGASKALKNAVNQSIVTYTNGFAEWIERNRFNLRTQKLLYYTDVYIEIQYYDSLSQTNRVRQKAIGIAGRFANDEALKTLIEMFENNINADSVDNLLKTA